MSSKEVVCTLSNTTTTAHPHARTHVTHPHFTSIYCIIIHAEFGVHCVQQSYYASIITSYLYIDCAVQFVLVTVPYINATAKLKLSPKSNKQNEDFFSMHVLVIVHLLTD